MYLCRFGWEEEEQKAATEFYEDFVKFCRKEENDV